MVCSVSYLSWHRASLTRQERRPWHRDLERTSGPESCKDADSVRKHHEALLQHSKEDCDNLTHRMAMTSLVASGRTGVDALHFALGGAFGMHGRSRWCCSDESLLQYICCRCSCYVWVACCFRCVKACAA